MSSFKALPVTDFAGGGGGGGGGGVVMTDIHVRIQLSHGTCIHAI